MWTAVWVTGALGARPKLELDVPPVPVEAFELCYPSGLEVVAVRRPGASVVAVTAVIGGGRTAEVSTARGAAHLAEHLWFESRNRAGVPIREVLSGLGVQGQTWPDATVFVTVAAPSDLRSLLRIEARRLSHPLDTLGEDDLQRARALVHDELVWRGAHWGHPAWERLERGLWPAGWDALRTDRLEDNDRLTLADVQEYARRVWVPSETTVRIEGDVDPTQLQALVDEAFPLALRAGTRTSCAHDAPGFDPPAPAAGLSSVEQSARYRALVFGWSVPGGYGAVDTLGIRAADWLETRLAYSVSVAKGMDPEDVDLSCSYSRGARASVVACETRIIDRADAAEAFARAKGALRGAFDDIAVDGPTWVGLQVRDFDRELVHGDSLDDDDLANRALFSHFTSGSVDATGTAARRVFSLAPPDVELFGKRWLTADRMVGVEVVPRHAVPELPRGPGAAVLAPPASIDWSTPSARLDGWTWKRFDNGLAVWVAPVHGIPLSHARMVYRHGASAAEIGAAEAHQLLAVIPTSIPSDELARRTGALYDRTLGDGALVDAALGPSGNLDGQIFALGELTGDEVYAGRASDVAGPDVRRNVRRLLSDPETYASSLHAMHLFPGHRLGTPWWEVYGRTAELGRGAASRWARAVSRPDNASLVVAGRVDPAEVDGLVTRFMGDWAAPDEPVATVPGPALPSARSTRALELGTELAWLGIACRLPPRSATTDAASDVAAWLVREGAAQTLRDAAGIYAVSVTTMVPAHDAAYLRLGVRIPPDDAPATVTALLGLLERVAQGPSPELVQWGAFGVRGEFARSTSSAVGAIAVAEESALAGMDLDALRGYPRRVSSVTGAEVGRALSDCVGREGILYLGPRVDLPGEVQWVDWRAESARIADDW